MAAAVAHTLQPPLPQLFASAARRVRLNAVPAQEAVRLTSEALMQTLNAIAFDASAWVEDARIAKDRRFSTALTVAVPLSLQGRPARPERFVELERKVERLVRDHGVAGPVGRALQGAQLIVRAAAGPPDRAADLCGRALDCSVEAEVLAGVLHDQNPAAARAAAESRLLDIFNARPRRACRPAPPPQSTIQEIQP